MSASFSNTSLTAIMLVYFLIGGITSLIVTRKNYPTDEYTNWILLGGLTSEGATFRIRRSLNDSVRRFVIATDQEFTFVIATQELESSSLASGTDNDNTDRDGLLVTPVTITGLDSNKPYFYATKDDQDNVLQRGRFMTAPVTGQASPFKFATAGCSWSGSTHDIFSTIAEEDNLLFFLHLGEVITAVGTDIHYEDLNVDSVPRRIQAMDRVLNSKSQRELYSLPLSYMWDDHDWLGNDSAGYDGFREAALESYRIAMPHYEPLPTSNSAYHAFTIGTVRFVVSDLRSEATEMSIYSTEQREWLFQELSNADRYDFVVWVTSKTWIDKADPTSDAWKGYSSDRRELSHWISTQGTKKNLLAISGDAHMLAFDDGSNTYYGDEGEESSPTMANQSSNGTIESFPILQSGPLDRLASFKGDTFSEGCTGYLYERNHQYSVLEFIPSQANGTEKSGPCLEIKTYRIEGLRTKQEVFTKRLCGSNIFRPHNPGVGSCDAKFFSTASTALIVVSSILVGFFVPLMMNINQFTAFTTGMVGLLEMITVVTFLGAWVFFGKEISSPDTKGDISREQHKSKADIQVKKSRMA